MIALGLAVLSMPAWAAANFSGTWTRDNSKSDAMPNYQYWLTRDPNSGGAAGGGRQGRGGGRGPQVVWKIQQDANSVSVTEPSGAIHKYMLNGKPEAEKTDTLVQKANVSAKMQGDNLEITTNQPWGGMPGNVGLEVKQTWSLSADGKTLTMTTTRIDPATVTKTFKQVWNKQ